jgi:hypothetical protein
LKPNLVLSCSRIIKTQQTGCVYSKHVRQKEAVSGHLTYTKNISLLRCQKSNRQPTTMSNVVNKRYGAERLPAGASSMPPVRITEISDTRKCLDMKHVDGNNVQRLVSVIGDEKNNVVEKHVTYKSPWNMPRLCHEYDRDGEVTFKWLQTDRYKKNLTFFGTYHIGTCITVLMESARTMKPFLRV